MIAGQPFLKRRAVIYLLCPLLIVQLAGGAEAGWSTDKWAVRGEIEANGWKTVYFKEIHSGTVIEATLAGYFGGYPGFSAWFSNWIYSAIREFGSNLEQNVGGDIKDAVENYLWENVFNELLNGRIPSDSLENFGTIDVKAGVAEYHGCNTIQIPFGGEQCWHYDLPSLQAYVAIRMTPGVSPHDTGNWAGWRVCNRTSEWNISVAYSYLGPTGWTRAGWRNIKKGECQILVNNITNNRYVYYYAETPNRSLVWGGSGNYELCVHPTDRFEIKTDKCLPPYETRPLLIVDTDNAEAFTTNLTE